jgi:uncharacterized HAD superfamily protein
MAEAKKLCIGVDFGCVCSVHAERYEQDTKSDELELINIPGCKEALTALRAAGHELILVSFCGAKRAGITKAYLKEQGLFDKLVFVKNRKYKASVCKFFGIDILIDDRLDVLQSIAPTRALHFTYEAEVFGKGHKIYSKQKMLEANTWPKAVEVLSKVEPLGLVPDPAVMMDEICYSWEA